MWDKRQVGWDECGCRRRPDKHAYSTTSARLFVRGRGARSRILDRPTDATMCAVNSDLVRFDVVRSEFAARSAVKSNRRLPMVEHFGFYRVWRGEVLPASRTPDDFGVAATGPQHNYRSCSVRPVRFAMRASIRGPISSPSESASQE